MRRLNNFGGSDLNRARFCESGRVPPHPRPLSREVRGGGSEGTWRRCPKNCAPAFRLCFDRPRVPTEFARRGRLNGLSPAFGQKHPRCGPGEPQKCRLARGALLREAGARVLWSVRSEERRTSASKLVGPDEPLFVCDVERQTDIDRLRDEVSKVAPTLHGIVHSIAYADYSFGRRPLPPGAASGLSAGHRHFVLFADRALGGVSRAARSDRAASSPFRFPPRGWPRKTTATWLPSRRPSIRRFVFWRNRSLSFPGCASTPFAPACSRRQPRQGFPTTSTATCSPRRATLRKEAVRTEEVAAAIAFLLSPRSSGINAQGLVIDAGMGINYFDRQIVTPGDANPPRGS